MVQVLRLEHEVHRCGPYGGGNKVRSLCDVGNGRQPLPEFHVNDSAYVFGFLNAEQANRWWDDTARMCAHKQGYKVSVYEVPSDAIGGMDDNQLIFDPRVAKLIAHIDPKDWVGGDLDYLLQSQVYNNANQQRRQSSSIESPLHP